MLLQQKILEQFGRNGLTQKAIPSYIKTGLAPSKELRDYQNECLLYFLLYMENYQERAKQPHLLFNMATGSGKTIIMAATILYLFEKGYRNFLFFVNTTNVIEKTRDNFFNTSSSKYLFASNLSIKGSRVEIREVQSFQGANQNCINICLKTLGKLHNELNVPRENGASYNDFAQTPVVLIADEAHHLNSNTKKKSKEIFEGEIFGGEYKEFDDENSRDWETTAQRIFLQNEKNILLEFTATHDKDNDNIRKKYEDKIIYKYELNDFCKAGFSKNVKAVKIDSDVRGRIIRSLVVSEYKRMLFSSLGKAVKPVVLFKSKRKTDNKDAIDKFIKELPELDEEHLMRIKVGTSDGIVKEAFDYFESINVSITSLALMLREQFGEEHLLQVDGNTKKNDEMTSEMQHRLNSLEDIENPIRAVFAVDMLNEGWDVLNLFDIVRLFDTRDANTKSNKPGKTTTQEAQLIGRGARYYAFIDKSKPELHAGKRKYDQDTTNPLTNIETLHYYCPNEPKMISELDTALKNMGIHNHEETMLRELSLKPDFMETDLYKNGIVFFNKRILKAHAKDDGTIGKDILGRSYDVFVPTGYSSIAHLISGKKEENSVDSKTKTVSIHFIELGSHVIRTALDSNPTFYYSNLREVFPSLYSLSAFIESENYLRDISIIVHGRNDSITAYTQKEKLFIAKTVLEFIKPNILKRKDEYIGSHDFEYLPIRAAFKKQRTLTFAKKAEDSDEERGIPMLESKKSKFRIDLSTRTWHAYNDCFGTSEEKALILYIDSISNKLKERYKEYYLIRNEKDVNLYDFETGERFEPDYILFLKKKNFQNRYDHLQIFLEPKGKGFKSKDQWKENFMKQISPNGVIRLCMESNEYRVWGMPFFTEQENDEFRRTFEEDFISEEQHTTNNKLIETHPTESEKFVRLLPLFEIKAACGGLESGDCPPEDEIIGWINIESTKVNPNKNMFIVRAKGDSMLPRIHEGDYCIFEIYGADGNAGSRNGQIVLAKRSGKDGDYLCEYTIKEYHSIKDPNTGQNSKIELRPLNTDGYEPIIVNPEEKGEIRILGILKDVINI